MIVSREKSNYEKGLHQYLSDDSMHIKRQYKEIDSSRILGKKISGIKHCARDEKFVRLLYYKDAWISNYGRCIVYENGEYKLLRGGIDKWSGERVYTLKKERYIKTTKMYKYSKVKVTASSLVVETFIVNYDMLNNTRMWHLNNDVDDNYYKHIYPVTEKQYDRLTELQSATSDPLNETEIMDVINAIEYKQDDWNPAHYKRRMCGVGYSGMSTQEKGYREKSYIRWKNMIQRCYDQKVQNKYKPEYKDKTVCEEWQNYANFKIWFDEHYVPDDNQLDLDKDLLVQGNKVYSPETCVFLKHYQNMLFERWGDCITKSKDGTFRVDKRKKMSYGTYEEAAEVVIARRQEKIERVAEKNKGLIPNCAYEAMLNWDVKAAVYG